MMPPAQKPLMFTFLLPVILHTASTASSMEPM